MKGVIGNQKINLGRTRRLNVKVTPDDYDRLEAYANRHRISTTDVVEKLIRKGLPVKDTAGSGVGQ